jgi:hypothetical protein
MAKKLATPFRYLAAGVYVRRLGDAIHVVTTGDNQPPDLGREDLSDGMGGSNTVLSKTNWILEQEVSVEGFADIMRELAPESRGQLVNVAPEGEEPFLLTQQQAARFGAVVDASAVALASAQAETAFPTPP